MIRWLSSLMGALILLIIGFFFYDMWFNPHIPPVLQQGNTTVVVNEQGRAPLSEPSSQQPQAVTPTTNSNGNAQITLTSLQDMESSQGAPPPVLTNPQGTKTAVTTKITAQQPVAKTPEVIRPVKISPTSTQEEKSSNKKATAWIQAGAFGDKDNANNFAASLKKQGMSVDIEIATVNGRQYNRVYVGPLTDDKVDTTLNKLSKMGINARQTTR